MWYVFLIAFTRKLGYVAAATLCAWLLYHRAHACSLGDKPSDIGGVSVCVGYSH